MKEIGHLRLFPSFFLLIVLFTLVRNNINAQNRAEELSTNELKKLSLIELMNLDVTSVSKRPEKLSDAASAIQVITYKDIRRSGATTIPEALRLASNLQVAQVNASQWAISARGFNNVLANKLLVLIDGRTVYTPMYAGVFWDIQNILLEDIERIEVISGPGGTLWGANAVNGVINITTKSSKETQGLFVEGVAGTQLKGYGSVRYGGSIGKNIYYRAYGMGYKHGSTMLTEGSADAGDDWNLGQGGVRFDWKAGDKDQVTLQSNIFNGSPNPEGNVAITASGNNTVGRWNHSNSEKSKFQLQLYYDKTWRDFNNGFSESLSTYDFDGNHNLKIGQRHNIIWGLGVRMMDIYDNNTELLGFSPAHKTLHIYNIFVQDQIRLHEKLKLTLGSKLGHNSYTGLEYQPNGRLAWTPVSQQTLWGAVSRAVRTPSRIDREFFVSLNPELPYITTSENFVSEKLVAYELGWRVEPKPGFNLSLSSFFNVYDDIRSSEPDPSPQGIPIILSNGVYGKTYGVELSTSNQLSASWHLRGGYTFLNKDLSIHTDSNDLNGGTAESSDPNHQFLIQTINNITTYMEFGSVIRYVGTLSNTDVPSYLNMDIRIGFKLPKDLELSVVGQNLLDNQHAEFIPSSPSPRNIKRSIYAKIIWRL